MPASQHDPHSLTEVARTVVLGYRIVRRQEKGKPTGRLEREVDRIREKAEQREQQRAKAREK
ncbi:hypothetical protein ABZ299_12495 [Streptomyces sp. NPDC006184]|uniref:hypothetical protein n=1 Tax=Streptomyces sp. NPDC006184 TaxID=3155455 RepID=UPI0033B77745